MAAISNCIIKSVNLAAGESYVLPPGAKLIGATDITSITSTCDIPTLEEVQCYIAAIGSHNYNGEAYSRHERIWFRGYRLNGVDTLFPSEIQVRENDECLNMGPVGDKLKEANIGVIHTDWSTSSIDTSDETCTNMLLIQTVPSVADNLEILVRMNAEDGTTQDPRTDTFPRLPFIPWDDYANPLKRPCPEPPVKN